MRKTHAGIGQGRGDGGPIPPAPIPLVPTFKTFAASHCQSEGLEIIAAGLQTGPTATLLTFVLGVCEIVQPAPSAPQLYGICGWLLSPFRYLDRWLMKKPDALQMGNHVYVLVRKPSHETGVIT